MQMQVDIYFVCLTSGVLYWMQCSLDANLVELDVIIADVPHWRGMKRLWAPRFKVSLKEGNSKCLSCPNRSVIWKNRCPFRLLWFEWWVNNWKENYFPIKICDQRRNRCSESNLSLVYLRLAGWYYSLTSTSVQFRHILYIFFCFLILCNKTEIDRIFIEGKITFYVLARFT